MDQVRVGAAFRAVRLRRGLRQLDVAERARVHRSTVSLVERGHWERLSFRVVTRLAAVLDMRLDVTPRWRGGELDRLLNAGHSQLHEVLAQHLGAAPDWQWQPEVSFAIYGERGWVDVLAFHPPTGSLLVIELKTVIVDVQQLLGVLDRKVRLAPQVARERGWDSRAVSAWVLVADTRTNRRRLAAHRAMLRGALPDEGRTVRGWLRRPAGTVRAFSFLSYAHAGSASRVRTGAQRIRRVP